MTGTDLRVCYTLSLFQRVLLFFYKVTASLDRPFGRSPERGIVSTGDDSSVAAASHEDLLERQDTEKETGNIEILTLCRPRLCVLAPQFKIKISKMK